jgi:hypothetical protein
MAERQILYVGVQVWRVRFDHHVNQQREEIVRASGRGRGLKTLEKLLSFVKYAKENEIRT